jgi:benzoyl-CoA reductase/2-hydroxyglutaryl-CoA dehydratase subunit BcrC/BadD/HgdB
MPALDELTAVYRDRGAAARAWKAKGGKVIAYVSSSMPEELVTAAGFLPYRLSGDPEAGFEALGRYYYPLADKSVPGSRVMSLEFINSIMALVFEGRFDFADLLVIPYARKAVLALYSHFAAAKAAFPELTIPELYLLDRTITPYYAGGLYSRDRVLDFKARLGEWAGAPVADAALSAAIAEGNETRRLLAELNRLRAQAKVPGAEALAVFGASRFMPKGVFNRLLAAALPKLATRPPRPGPKLFVSGSPLDNTRLYEVIEACGATIVGESHDWGAPMADLPLREAGDPTEAAVERFHKSPPDLIFPLDAAVGDVVDRATACGADGAVFHVYRHDDHELFDVPAKRAALEAAGVPTLYLQEQPYRLADPAPVREATTAFLVSLRS